MAYLHRTAERRADVRHVLPSARTVIVTATVYNTDRPYSTESADAPAAQIARYAWGDDYHDVIGGAARRAAAPGCATRRAEPFDARAYVDTGPVQERVYAQHAGIGWIGKNTCVINPRARIVDLPRRNHLQPAARRRRAGARSVRHLHAVPRGVSDAGARRAGRARFDALHFVSDDRAARRHSGRARAGIGSHVYGCDICQEVCPWNAVAPRSTDPAWQPRPAWDRVDLLTLSRRSDEELSVGAARQRDATHEGARSATQHRRRRSQMQHGVGYGIRTQSSPRS